MKLEKINANTFAGNLPLQVELTPGEEANQFHGTTRVHSGCVVFATFSTIGNATVEGVTEDSTGRVIANINFDYETGTLKVVMDFPPGWRFILTAGDREGEIQITFEIV